MMYFYLGPKMVLRTELKINCRMGANMTLGTSSMTRGLMLCLGTNMTWWVDSKIVLSRGVQMILNTGVMIDQSVILTMIRKVGLKMA